MHDIPNGLRAARTRAGMTQEELAEASGVTRRSLSNWEAGRFCMSLEEAIMIADALNIPLDTLAKRKAKVFSADNVKF